MAATPYKCEAPAVCRQAALAGPRPAAVSVATAIGMPAVTGAIQSIWALEASSSTPVISAPMRRDKNTRMTNPSPRVAMFAAESTAACWMRLFFFMCHCMGEKRLACARGCGMLAKEGGIALDKWDKRFMEMARLVSSWSSCYQENRKIGAVVVRQKRILTTGYNGRARRR